MALHDNSSKMTRQETAGTPTQFDMFAERSGVSALRPVTELRAKRPVSVPMTEDEMVLSPRMSSSMATGRPIPVMRPVVIPSHRLPPAATPRPEAG